jgi:hypothetical protein
MVPRVVGGFAQKAGIMKLKGINPFEQHVEKAVLGVAGVAFVGAMVWQFLLAKPEVKVGSATVSPGNAFEPIKDEAKRLASQMDATSPALPTITMPSFGNGLQLGKATPGVESQRVAMGNAPKITSNADTKIADAVIGELKLPAPTGVVAMASRASISPIEKLRSKELAALLPAEQPFDKVSVSIEAMVDGMGIKALLESDPDGAGPLSPMPLSWWRDVGSVGGGRPMVEILGIEVERQTVQKADGSSAGETIVQVAPAPDRPAFAAHWKELIRGIADVPPALDEVRAAGEEVLRPEFYQIVSGAEWMPPSEQVAAGAQGDVPPDVARLKSELSGLDKQITQVEKQMKDGNRPGGRGVGGRGDGRDQGGGTPGGSGGGRGGRGGGGPPPAEQPREAGRTPQEEAAQRLKNLQTRVERARKRREDVVKQLAEKGVRVGDAPSTSTEADKPWLDDAKIRVWTHDMTVVPGETYRYRVRVVMNNPMFGRGLQEAQKQLGESATLAGAWTEWSAPLRVENDREFFVTGAQDRDPQTGRARATAELFQFYYGYYRSTTISAEPGDAFVGKITLPAEMKYVDMKWLEAELAAGRMPDLVSLAGVASKPEDGQDSPRQDDGRDGRSGPRGGLGGGQPGGASGSGGPLIQATAAPKQIPVAIETTFLGVRNLPTEGGSMRVEAVVRNAGTGGVGQAGQIMALSPESQRQDEAYRRLNASAQAAQAASRPKEEKKDETEQNPRKRDEPAPPPTRAPGGGGG